MEENVQKLRISNHRLVEMQGKMSVAILESRVSALRQIEKRAKRELLGLQVQESFSKKYEENRDKV
jgi:hypothetical protein